MANKTNILLEAETPVLGSLLHADFAVDTDGLPGLEDAPGVYDLILRDLHQDGMWMSVKANTDPKASRDGAPRKTR